VLGRYENMRNDSAMMWIAPSIEQNPKPNEVIAAEFAMSDATIKNAFVARLWAQQRIQRTS
jgi:hypothetical protein